ncbi:MAG: hypothetical protein RMJ18_03275, partial [Candidatus Aenigmarchaeota archaeon]|nr:hypothetical protein [Candidatus Aenigmarchaeota archaeon]MDW8160408.1 hypothetical protein [Candidatus Aenigmarchaeota archaeon]
EAQTQLKPGEVNIIIYSIVLTEVEDYTGSYQYIGLGGDKSRIDIYWNARYEPHLDNQINVTCWLNCRNFTNVTECHGLRNCSYQGSQGPASCTIFNPTYNYSSPNFIVCRFFNPSLPELEYKLADGTYPRRTFYPVRHSVSSVGGVYTVGTTVSLPITFLSYSFLKGNYTAFIHVPQEFSNYLYVDNSHNTTREITYSTIGSVYPKLTFLLQIDRVTFYINTTANELPTYTSVSQCPSSDVITGRTDAEISLINNRCIYSFRISSGSIYYSMSEYDFLTALLIIILAVFVFFVVIKLR